MWTGCERALSGRSSVRASWRESRASAQPWISCVLRSDRPDRCGPAPSLGLLLLATDAHGAARSATLAGVRLGALAPQVSLDLEAAVDDLAQAVDLILGQVARARVARDVGSRQDLARRRGTDAIDIGKRDLRALLTRDVDAGDACHLLSLSPSPDAA